VVSTTDSVLEDQAPDGTDIDILPQIGRWIAKRFDAVPKRSPKPATERDLETLLRPRKNRVWNDPFDGASE
jgi:hypothetical protein